ncbi:MAG: TonB-dependent receptor domain-containing protein [Candidatus Acidiferrales bacterium]
MRHFLRAVPAVVFACLMGAALAWASITGSISGVVTDQNGGVVVGAKVTAIETQTGVRSEITTDSQGFYNFPALPVGKYDVEVQSSGFKRYRQSGLVIDVNSALRVDVALQVGEVSERVTVSSEAVHVETDSTQIGEVITGTRMTTVPLDGRSYTDLLSLQPGVVPSAYGAQAPGTNDRSPSGGPAATGGGGVNSGNQSVNGQREAANGFMVNGALVNEGKNNGAAVVPNLDAIAEFRIITSNFDAEYGNFSGGQINLATKSGTNTIHGSAFEFLRNTALDARNFFDPPGQIGDFKQNQFGGTAGGPIKKDKLFFFADYQGTRQIRGQTVNTVLPSAADRTGNLADQAASLSGSVGGQAFAKTLSQRLGYTVTQGEPYFSGPACAATGPNPCVFPGAIIPQNAWSPAAASTLPFIPQGDPTTGAFATSAFPNRLRDDKTGLRVDGNTRFGMLSAYYFFDDYNENDAYPNGGATVPGFNGISLGRTQLISLGDSKTFGSTAVNEFHLSYTRNAAKLFTPQGGLGHTLSSLGFTQPVTSGGVFNGGIAPVDPKLEGIPNIAFNNFTIGVPSDTVGQFNNTYQLQDNFSKVIGRHTLRFGGQFHYDQINERNFFGENGAFGFFGGETGSDFADFLVGAPDSFIQATHQILDSRTKYAGLFLQDSWRVKSNVTFNYGLRWEMSQPWYDTQNKTETIIPGVQSAAFPNAPKGWLVPGDPGVPRTLAPTKYDAFSPRLGLAYSPNVSEGILAKLTGGPGKTSIRVGYGIYYTSIEDLSQFLEVGDPPYGVFWVSTAPPFFEAPFNARGTGTPEPASGQSPFPFVFPPPNVSAKNPDTTFPWTTVEPISSGFVFWHQNRMPYSEHYELSVQRELGSQTVLSVGYVGNQGHGLITSIEANPGSPAICNQVNAVIGAGTCGPFGENTQYTFPSSAQVPAGAFLAPGSSTTITGTRTVLDPLAFGSNPYMKEIANSAYHSLQTTLRHQSGRAEFLFGYTYSKCLDNSSGLQDTTNPFNPKLSRSLCAFDVTQNFVSSYSVQLGIEKLLHAEHGIGNKVAAGWSWSGITTFATGLPISLSENDDNSLTGAVGVDLPQLSGTGSLFMNKNPRSGQPYFNPAFFTTEPIGQIGNANRRFFHGPGLYNFDMALLKDTKLTESKILELRFEAFNIFNHAQFQNPNGLINSSLFGMVTSANPPRVMQVAAKFRF